jgi:general secretion pathway protein K
MKPLQAPRRGAALLVAMVLLTIVTTLAAGMVWQQWKGVQIETAERARAQSAWILQGALDWARLILREDARSGRATSLNEPWATPLAEARLSTFLAADSNHSSDGGPEAFLAGSITDANARYNLRNLLDGGKVVPAQLLVLQRLCTSAGLGPTTADLIAKGLEDASTNPPAVNAPLPPQQIADLAWLGLDAITLERLSTVAVLLPVATPLNLNTAPREVLAAVVPGLDLGSADRMVQARTRKPFAALSDVTEVIGQAITLNAKDVAVKSEFFEVRGRLRLEQRVLEEQTLVQRINGLDVQSIGRLRHASQIPLPR